MLENSAEQGSVSEDGLSAAVAPSSALAATPPDSNNEVAIELMGLGVAHFGLTIQDAEQTVRIRARLVEKRSGVVRGFVSITMAHGDAATLARQIAAELKLKHVFWTPVIENADE